MPPPGGRFGPQILSGPFSQLANSHLQHHGNQQQPPGSAGLPPPSFNGHPGFPHSNQNLAISPFASSNGSNALGGGFGGNGGFGGAGTGLGSQAAMAGFAQGAAMQQQATARAELKRNAGSAKGQKGNRIREVWQSNLGQEMQTIRDLVDKYPYISMDTEFPGVVARPMGKFTTKADYHYQTLRCNVDLLQVIQLGITLFSDNGKLPDEQAENGLSISGHYPNNMMACPYTWQFNFRFSINNDMHNQESIEFLESVGMNMAMHERDGIDPHEFGAMLISSGLVLLEDVKWISFHSGYDFGYLVKIMLCSPLPDEELAYRKLLRIFFPAIYDIKFMIRSAQKTQMANDTPLSPNAASVLNTLGTKGGLQDLADELGVKRIGPAHQAGSDSLITGKVFWEVKKTIFNGTIDDSRYLGQVWGLHEVPTDSRDGSTMNRFDNQTTPNLNGATIYTNNGTPSTPNTTHTGPAHTPIQNQSHLNGGSMGSLTPGGGGGAFGRFGYGKS